MPSLCSSGPMVRPGALRSTRKPVNFSPSTLANTVNRSAKPALVMNCFVPVRRQLFPSGDSTALVLAAHEVVAGLLHHPLLVGEHLGDEDAGGAGLLEEEAAAGAERDLGARRRRLHRHPSRIGSKHACVDGEVLLNLAVGPRCSIGG